MHPQQIPLRVESKLFKILLAALTMITLAIIGFSCNPAKRMVIENEKVEVLKQQFLEERQRIAAEAVATFVQNNPCNPVPYINLDSLCSIYYQCPDNIHPGDYFYSDTLKQKDQSWQLKPKTILVPYTDQRALQLLKDSCTQKDKRIAVLNALLQSSKAVATVAVQEGLKQKNTWLWFFIVLCAIEALTIILIAKK